ncbi:MAG: TIGR03915 family putative DNA repair protein [Gracilibacteraceae bacterium]|jgi:probable DNA metabolism protein|nr:TIGR03915 family putative DNA repair protein [Gracilibacteraceae bacterium]
MIDYLYDETFDGLLTCIFAHYYEEKAAGIYPERLYQPSLLHGARAVAADRERAGRVYAALEQKAARYVLRKIYYTFLSAVPGKENIILAYTVLAFRLGPRLTACRTRPEVLALETASDRVDTERERFLGFVRFRDMGRFLYAAIAPDHNILPLLADHFTDRLAGEYFMIHDTGRDTALVWDKRDPSLVPFRQTGNWRPNEDERLCQSLWREYFEHIAISERRNTRLQGQFVPRRYRAHLTEFQGFGPASG